MSDLKVTADLSVSCNVECPKCENVFDLFSIQGLLDDGYIYKEIMGDRWGKEDWGEIVECPDCKEKLTIGEVVW